MQSIPAVSEEEFSALYPQLTSLTISHNLHRPNYVYSLLSHTPSLVYLKLTGVCDSMIDASRWEQLIKTKLPTLNKFEFHDVSQQESSSGESRETLLNRVIGPFRTPFWTEEKRWLVIGTWHPENRSIEIYTPLVSTPDYLPFWHPDTLTVTNFTRQNQYYRKYTDVLHLQIMSCQSNSSEKSVSRVKDFELSFPSDTNSPFSSESIDQ